MRHLFVHTEARLVSQSESSPWLSTMQIKNNILNVILMFIPDTYQSILMQEISSLKPHRIECRPNIKFNINNCKLKK